ncbi:MAG: SDR family NAD(P)-dependent oxidoreductase [Bacteroidia bacterium]|nr:SDR family NAD(P)-dependent oxidoreductase [Bacteroidia bacterium]
MTYIKIQKAAEEIGHGTVACQLNVSDPSSCDRFYNLLAEKFTSVDVLVNNAGIIGNKPATAFDMGQMQAVLNVNLLGAMYVTKALWPLLEKSKDARIINISSGMGSLQEVQSGGYTAYRLSKWSLNGYTMLLAADAPAHIKVNCICPGWVQTDMGGPNAPRTVQQGADTAVWLASEKNIPTGKFFRDRKEINW